MSNLSIARIPHSLGFLLILIFGMLKPSKNKAAEVPEIPYFCNHASEISAGYTRECLRNARIVFLGDSSMTERVQDLAMIYSGAETNHTLVEEFTMNPIHGSCHNPYPNPTTIEFPEDTHLLFTNSQRNFSIYSERNNFSAHFRFTGHFQLTENHYGIATWFHPQMRDELDCTLGFMDGCTVPNTLVINSAHHDAANKANPFREAYFERMLLRFLVRTNAEYVRRLLHVRMYWMRTIIVDGHRVAHILNKIEEIAHRVITLFPNGYYVNTSHVLTDAGYYAHPQHAEYTVDDMHFGMIAHSTNHNVTGNVSLLATKTLIASLCDDSCQPRTIPLSSLKMLTKSDILSLATVVDYRGFVLVNMQQQMQATPSTSSTLTRRKMLENNDTDSNPYGENNLILLDMGWIRPVPNKDVQYALGGNNPAHLLNITSDVMKLVHQHFPIGPAVSTDIIDNSLVRPVSGKTVFWLENGYRRPIKNAGVFFARGWDFGDVKTISDEDAEVIPYGAMVD